MNGIGNRIRSRRNELGLSVEDLAALIGKDRATVYRYENGDIENLPLTVLIPLSSALKTTPADLMGIGEYQENVVRWLAETDAEKSGRKLGKSLIDRKLTTAFHKSIELSDDDKEMVISFVNRLYEGRANS